MRRTQTGPPVAWIWTGVVVLAALLVSVFLWVTMMRPPGEIPSNARQVPNVIDMSWDRANEELGRNDLQARQLEESSDSIAAGNVIRTDPEPGTTVTPGEEITVYVSTGQELSTVPRLEALTRSEATEALDDADLRLGRVTTENDPDLAAGTVISASVAEGDEVAIGTAVDLVVASGRVTVVNMAGYRLDAAQGMLEADDLALTPRVVEDPNCVGDTENPTVKSQSAVGDVPIHSTIELVVCTGS